ncbi:hypothetical protein D7Y23_30330 [Corallococcus sp. AB050B]|nr:hypothetical protein D7Y23_30330 [Corallococcus sp. AB050B]
MWGLSAHAQASVDIGVDIDADIPDLTDILTIDWRLSSVLHSHGFTGRVQSQLEQRLGRPVDARRADLGRMLFFDKILSINGDNTCSGCHSPTTGFGDTQSIAIGIENNDIVGPGRVGPRNQRRTPMVLNNAFFPRLMWNSRFKSLSGDPFNPSAGLEFPAPEGLGLSYQPHLLVAQAFIPPTERVEMGGFDFVGDNFALRAEVVRRLNASPSYRQLFAQAFPEIAAGQPISYDHLGLAIAEFEYTLTFANAPIDRFARGNVLAMTPEQKRGALLFFGKAGCVQCHAVSGQSNEMFSDFEQHVIGVPQVYPAITNVTYDGPGANEDFGLEQVTGNPADRYMFRTSPLRNVALQPTFMHNGAFTTLEDAIAHHLNVAQSARNYTPALLAADLRGATGPIEPVLQRVDPLVASPKNLSAAEFRRLVEFVRNGLLDSNAKPQKLRALIPTGVPSGEPVHVFQ